MPAHLPRFVRFAASLFLPLVACAAPDGDDGVASGDQAQVVAKTAIERRLTPPVATPQGTPIGRSMDAVVGELGQGLRALEPRVGTGSTTTYWVDAEGREVFHREVTVRSDIVRVGYRGPSSFDAIYADHAKSSDDAPNGLLPKDGRVDSYSGKPIGTFTSLEDNDRDGKLDLAIEPAPENVDLSAYGDWRLTTGGTLANRIFEDRDHDGRFEIESLTAKASTGSWFLTGEP